MFLLYADDVVLFANTLGDAQKLMKALEIFCMHTKLSVNISKTKIMLIVGKHVPPDGRYKEPVPIGSVRLENVVDFDGIELA